LSRGSSVSLRQTRRGVVGARGCLQWKQDGVVGSWFLATHLVGDLRLWHATEFDPDRQLAPAMRLTPGADGLYPKGEH
jgi:hypothetical protein